MKVSNYKDLIVWQKTIEVETQLVIAKELGFLTEKQLGPLESSLVEIIKMFYVMVYRKGEVVKVAQLNATH